LWPRPPPRDPFLMSLYAEGPRPRIISRREPPRPFTLFPRPIPLVICPWDCYPARMPLQRLQIRFGGSMRRARKKTTDFSPRRRWPRQKVDVPVRLVLRGYNRTFLVEGCGNDLSEGGMLVFAGLQLPVGREVEVEIQLPESREPLRLPATIRDRDRYFYGLEFTVSNSEQQSQIARLRESLA